jgi:hypothetical protein
VIIPRSNLSHLTALRDDNVLEGLALWIGHCPRVLDLGHDVHTVDDGAENDVLTVEMRGPALRSDDEELRTVGVWSVHVSTGISRAKYGVSPAVLRYVSSSHLKDWCRLTAMESRPGLSCCSVKFSSANFSVP